MPSFVVLEGNDINNEHQNENLSMVELCQNFDAGKFDVILSSHLARFLFGHEELRDLTIVAKDGESWNTFIIQRVSHLLIENLERDIDEKLIVIGKAALHAFLQSNVTGPPLEWSPTEIVFPVHLRNKFGGKHILQHSLLSSLTVDGEAAYRLIPNVELFCLAKIILNHASMTDNGNARRARLQVNFWHQCMLNENTPSLQLKIYEDLDGIDQDMFQEGSQYDSEHRTKFLLERAAIHIYHGFDAKAREDLSLAAEETGLQHILTGRLGKRTKFQETELSQLVVLAKSTEADQVINKERSNGNVNSPDLAQPSDQKVLKPKNLNLNDDTLLESISFTHTTSDAETQTEQVIPETLATLDPAHQPILKPLDSIILLSLASSITNISPQDGLTREETLPYATRVLEGGSSNWQIFTQALLVRSRIEGYRSRTRERGLLQLQALVDQVIAETTPSHTSHDYLGATNETIKNSTSTFLPRVKKDESAPASERLKYIHQLASPTRWTLEAELAARWVSEGGLRTACEIYERLEMWAETALCWAALDREDKARKIVRRQLYSSTSSDNVFASQGITSESDDDLEEYLGEERDPLPADAPRLFCILGDMDKSPVLYERAWTVSNNRYARAQRSLGKHYLTIRDLPKADAAYSASLKINPQNQSTWFALGCVRLEIQDWPGAVDAFGRTIQIEEGDAEAWSNLAAALLRLPASSSVIPESTIDDLEERPKSDPQKHTREAFAALKKAASLKRESYRIWQNLLNVSATLSPPPYSDLIIAQQRLIELRGSTEGEGCVDIEIVEGLLAHVIASTPSPTSLDPHTGTSPSQPPHQPFGLQHMFSTLLNTHITPLITHSRRLWLLTARYSLHLNRPSSALSAYEKAWRVTLNKPGWESSSSVTSTTISPHKSTSAVTEDTPEEVWKEVVDATLELVDAY